MKKMIALLLSVILIVPLAACGAEREAFEPSISHAPAITVTPKATPADTPAPEAASPTSLPTATVSPQMQETQGNMAEDPLASAPATDKTASPEETVSPRTQTVYWTPNGKVYHTTPDCSSLAKSKTILEGSAEESGKSRACRKCG